VKIMNLKQFFRKIKNPKLVFFPYITKNEILRKLRKKNQPGLSTVILTE
jgi:hypothetical protein